MRSNSALPKPYIHSDVFTSMTGFTRFLYENENLGWKYNRTENMTDPEYLVYTHLFSDRKDYEGFTLYKEPIKSYERLDIKAFLKNPFKNPLVLLKDCAYILEREDVSRIRKGLE